LIGGVIFIGWIFYGLGARHFPLFAALRRAGQFLSRSRHPWTPMLFVLAAAAIVGNAVYLAFRDPSQLRISPPPFLPVSNRSPGLFLLRKRAAS